MVNPLSLPTLQALATQTDYGGDFVITSQTAVVSLSAAVWLQNYDNWQGSGDTLTTSEKDEIDALVAELISENMGGGGAMTQDFVKLGESVYTSDVVTPDVSDLDVTGFRSLKILISGMLTNYSGNWVDSVLLTFNGSIASPLYNSFGYFMYGSTNAKLEVIGTRPGLNLAYASVSQPPNLGYFGNVEITVFNPSGNETKHISFDASLGGASASRIVRVSGTGTWKSMEIIDQISITPYDGTTFMIDTAKPIEPDELRLSVYGVR